MDETSSLTNPSFQKTRLTLYLWWGLNISIVIFVFLAFLFSTLSYVNSNNLAKNVNDTFISQQGGLIENTYNVSTVWSVRKGSVVSFCGRANAELCEGLGPLWSRPFFSHDSWTPAILGSIAQLTPAVSVYLHVVESDHLTLRVSYVDTGLYPAVNHTALLTLKSPVSSIHARATSHPDTAVIMYTTANETFIQAVWVTSDGGIKFAPKAYDLFPNHSPNENGTLVRNIAAVGTWTLVSYAYWGEGAKYEVFTVDPTNADYGLTQLTGLPAWSFGLRIEEIVDTLYLGNGFILQATANLASYGLVDFNAKIIHALAQADYFARFHSLSLTQLEGDMVLFVGTQVDFVDQPLTLSMIVQWSNNSNAPSLKPHIPTNLLGTNNHIIVNDVVSVCYHPPSSYEPFGGIFFSYVDGLSRKAKIARARPTLTNGNLHVLPSPPLDVSSHQYGRYQSWLTPRLVCPVGTGPSHVLIVLQDFNSAFNTFVWAGGYRFAGIAQAAATAGKGVDVVRQGISTANERFTPGFTYYAWNDGTLAPFTSFAELFTPNGYPYPIGTAIGEEKLHLELEAFDRLGTN